MYSSLKDRSCSSDIPSAIKSKIKLKMDMYIKTVILVDSVGFT